MADNENSGPVVIAETVTVDGCAIRFELHGNGIPLVYTPGAFYSLESSRLVADTFAPLGYQVLLWDRPNTGGADLLFEPTHMLRLWADKLDGLLEYLGISSAYAAGVTNGLLASLHFAVWYPARVRGLVLVAALEGNPKWWKSVAEAFFLEPAKVIKEEGMAAALAIGNGQCGWIDPGGTRCHRHPRDRMLGTRCGAGELSFPFTQRRQASPCSAPHIRACDLLRVSRRRVVGCSRPITPRRTYL
jgi:pimeloyl-ACP methyl ester carboxylesterase